MEIQLVLNSSQIEFDYTSKVIKLKYLDHFDIEQLKNFKHFNYKVIVIKTELCDIRLEKDKYAIRIYDSCARFSYRE